MNQLSYKKEVSGEFESVIQKLTDALKAQGFGVLTRIDFHEKMKEKLGKTDVPKTAILGACHPPMAYEAFTRNTDVTGVMPCNAVVREVGQGRFSVELARPSELMKAIGDQGLVSLACEADARLESALRDL